MLLQRTLFPSFLWLSSIPLCMWTTSSLYIHLSIDRLGTVFASTHQLL